MSCRSCKEKAEEFKKKQEEFKKLLRKKPWGDLTFHEKTLLYGHPNKSRVINREFVPYWKEEETHDKNLSD